LLFSAFYFRRLIMSECACSGGNGLIFSCSGAADLGALSDQVARKLARDGKGKLYCTAVVGANVSEKIAPIKTASEIMTIDGCSVLCAKKTLENAGFAPKSYNLEGLGFQKGKTEVSSETIASAINKMGF
jgi:uncharacterized metal-binding protein